MRSAVVAMPKDDAGTLEYTFDDPGSRLFFLLAAVYGAAVLILWVVFFRLQLAPAVAPVLWHAHEMLYGFAAAGLAGLLLAVVPRWSDAPAVGKAGLGALAVIWLLGRVAMAFIGTVPTWAAAAVDLAFIPVLAGIVIVPLLTLRLGPNLLMLALCSVVWAGDWTMHAGWLGWTYEAAERGARIGMDAYLLLIVVVGGYTIPVLTNRALQSWGSHLIARSFPLLDRLAIASMALYVLSDIANGTSTSTRCLALVAAILNGVRLSLWRGIEVRRAPMLGILHLGYFWLVVGLLIEVAALFGGAVADMAAVHVLTAGAIGTMLIAAMSRAGAANRGQLLAAHPVVVAAYALVTLAAMLRVAALLVPGQFAHLVIASGVVWALAYVVFLLFYLPGAVFRASEVAPGSRVQRPDIRKVREVRN
jgi:uncharacterized protein involved in response to NO